MKAVRWAEAILAAAVLLAPLVAGLAGCSREREMERTAEQWRVKGVVKEVSTDAGNVVLRYAMLPKEYWSERVRVEKGLSGKKKVYLFRFGNRAVVAEALAQKNR